MVIEPLMRYHDREAFDCGEPSLNDYLRRFARQNQEGDIGRAFVAVDKPGSTGIQGYYTLSSHSVDRETVPEKGLPRYAVPVALLGRLAVDIRSQSQSVGGLLLKDALRRCAAASESLAIYAVVVDALNAEAKAFYEHYGFRELIGHPNRLYLPMKSIRASLR